MDSTEEIKQEEIINSDEKLLSLLCHLSMILGGILVPIIIWAIQKDKSKFVRFHSLQSIFYHLAYSVIIGIIVAVFMIIFIGSIGFHSTRYYRHGEGLPEYMIFILIFFGGVMAIFVIAGLGYGIYLAIKSYQGEKIRVPVIGKIIYEKVYGKV
jgi:uncharacterized Tic20 family protein